MIHVTTRTSSTIGLDQISKKDVSVAGGKAASLGEVISLGIPVPPGFVVTVNVFDAVVSRSAAAEVMAEYGPTLSSNGPEAAQGLSKRIRDAIECSTFDPEEEHQIRSAYGRLGQIMGVKDPPVAVRSSSIGEDSGEASFAGQMESYLHVCGADNVLRFIKRCFSSAFTPRSMLYRAGRGQNPLSARMAVVVQAMVEAESAGVLFTVNPSTGDESVILIEGIWGLAEPLTGGAANPDRFLVEKGTLTIIDRQIAQKTRQTVRNPDPDALNPLSEMPVDPKLQGWPCLNDSKIVELARYAKTIEEHYGKYVDIEWAIQRKTGEVYILQARPETVWSQKDRAKPPQAAERAGQGKERVLCRGLGASPGIVTANPRVIARLEEAVNFRPGEVLVSPLTTPDWLPTMKKASAIVTDVGGMTSHTAIVSRELGIPCVVGAKDATTKLQSASAVTVDGTLGLVYAASQGSQAIVRPTEVKRNGIPPAEGPITATRIFMNLSDPDKIEDYVELPFDGIGLMRTELMIAGIGDHPMQLIKEGKPQVFVDKLAYGIAKVARAIYPRPMLVRFSDFKSNEFRALRGGESFEPHESNPMIGWRGVSRYISEAYQPAFRLECQAIRKVREEMRLRNVWVMIPFVRNVWEVQEVYRIMEEEGLRRGRDLKVWLMAEVPSMFILAEEFMKFCDGLSIGSNDVVQLVLGVDRDSDTLTDLGYFDERDPSVLRVMKRLIKVAHKHGIQVSICGQAPTVYPEVTAFLVEQEIDCISVNPDAVLSTRKLVASLEQKMILRRLASPRKGSGLSNSRVPSVSA